MKKSEAGFAAVVLIILVVFVALGVFAFMRVTQSSNPPDSNGGSSSSEQATLNEAENNLNDEQVDITAEDEAALEAEISQF